MRKTLLAGLLLLGFSQVPAIAAPPPDGGEDGVWAPVTVQAPTSLKINVRGQRLFVRAYSTSLGDEYLVAADDPELYKIAAMFNGKLSWDEDSLTLSCLHKGVHRSLKVNENKVQGPSSVPGAQECELAIPAQVLEDKAYVPLSALEDFLDTRVTVRPNQVVYIEPLLRNVRFEGAAHSPKLILETTAPVNYKAFTLKNPDRYVIDIPGVVIDTPSLTVQHPDLGNVRLGQFELGPAITRVVIPKPADAQIRPEGSGPRDVLSWQMQLSKPIQMAAPAVTEIQDVRLEKTDKGHRIILTANEPLHFDWQRLGEPRPRWLMDINGAFFKPLKQEFEVSGKFNGSIRLSQNQPAPNPVFRVVVDLDAAVEVNTSPGENDHQLVIDVLDKEADPGLTGQKGHGSTEQVAQASGSGTGLIVIDPGHGGSDCGALNRGLNLSEASVTLDICKRLQGILKAQGWNVVMTRTTDVDVSYANSSAREELGARCKVANDAKADLFVSVHCNASVNAGSNGTSIHYYKQSDYVLASQLQSSVMNGTGRANRGLQANRFYVLAHTNMPAVLVETAFLTNGTEGALLNDPNYRQKIAEGLAQGLRQYASRQLNWGTASK
ncbi:N-acetylmuramoyl-L-alanine amidase [bacterium]|nr:N-acetylmuramoyl-L-alanine amidase [bacterium]